MENHRPLFAPHRRRHLHPPPGLDAERLTEQRLLRQLMVQQHHRRRRLVVVELGQERRQHGVRLHVPRMGREKRPVAVVAPAADEEHLHARLPADLVRGHYVGVGEAGRIDDGRPLHMGQAANAVAHRRRALELQLLRRLLHFGGQRRLHRVGLARQEGFRLRHQLRVIRLAHPAHARRGAAPDLEQQAGPAAVGEHRVLAGAQQEHPLHRRHRLIDGPGRRERPVIAPAANLRAPVLADLREGMVLGQRQPRIALVVPQHDVEPGLQPLDEVRLQQQRLGLGVGGDDLHAGRLGHHPPQPLRQAANMGVARHPLLEAARLADIERVALSIEHTIHAGAERHGGERRFNNVDARSLGAGWLQIHDLAD